MWLVVKKRITPVGAPSNSMGGNRGKNLDIARLKCDTIQQHMVSLFAMHAKLE